MRLIDSDAFKEEVTDMTVKFNLNPVRCVAICKIIDKRTTAIDLSNIIMISELKRISILFPG